MAAEMDPGATPVTRQLRVGQDFEDGTMGGADREIVSQTVGRRAVFEPEQWHVVRLGAVQRQVHTVVVERPANYFNNAV